MPWRRRRLAFGDLALEPRRGLPVAEGDSAAARARLDEALELARMIGDTRVIGFALENFGWLELLEGNRVRAVS